MFPVAESISDPTLSLPLSAAMTDDAVDRVIEACHDVAADDLRVLFRRRPARGVAIGHLVRCRSLARALGVRPLVALRGGRGVAETRALGCDVVTGSASTAARSAPDVLIVDDPMPPCRVAGCGSCAPGCGGHHPRSGLGCRDADLVIDGSIPRNAAPAPA